MAKDTLTITDNRTGKQYELPIEHGAIRATDLRQIKTGADDFGLMAYDPAFINTASCKSRITYIDGDKGILRYRGYPIEELAEKSTYLETAYLIVKGELPDADALRACGSTTSRMHTMVHENVKKFMDGFRYDAHPMGMLVGTVGALSTFYPDAKNIYDLESRRMQTRRLIGKMPTIAAFAYRHSRGLPYVYPDNELTYTGNFLNDALQDDRAAVQAEPGARARARRALHPARRPRAELLDQRHARRRQLAGRSVLGGRRRRRRRSTARCTAAPTRRSSACCTEIGSMDNVPGLHQAGEGRRAAA